MEEKKVERRRKRWKRNKNEEDAIRIARIYGLFWSKRTKIGEIQEEKSQAMLIWACFAFNLDQFDLIFILKFEIRKANLFIYSFIYIEKNCDFCENSVLWI